MSRFVKVHYSAGMCGTDATEYFEFGEEYTDEDINEYFSEYVSDYCEMYGVEEDEDVEMELDFGWEVIPEGDLPAGKRWQKA